MWFKKSYAYIFTYVYVGQFKCLFLGQQFGNDSYDQRANWCVHLCGNIFGGACVDHASCTCVGRVFSLCVFVTLFMVVLFVSCTYCLYVVTIRARAGIVAKVHRQKMQETLQKSSGAWCRGLASFVHVWQGIYAKRHKRHAKRHKSDLASGLLSMRAQAKVEEKDATPEHKADREIVLEHATPEHKTDSVSVLVAWREKVKSHLRLVRHQSTRRTVRSCLRHQNTRRTVRSCLRHQSTRRTESPCRSQIIYTLL